MPGSSGRAADASMIECVRSVRRATISAAVFLRGNSPKYPLDVLNLERARLQVVLRDQVLHGQSCRPRSSPTYHADPPCG